MCRRVALALTLVCGLTSSGAASATEPGLGVSDTILLTLAQRVVDRQVALSELWPGYWPSGQPFILHHPGVGWVEGGGLSPGGLRFQAGSLPNADAGYELDYLSGLPDTVVLRIESANDDLDTLFHEQFHDFQKDAFGWEGFGASEFVDLPASDRPAFAATAELERRILIEALEASDLDQRRTLAATYIALRRDRINGLPQAIDDAEGHREWVEGTANYVGAQAAALIADRDDIAIRDRIVTQLSQDLIAPSTDFVSSWFRLRAYGVGAAQAWLLDSFEVDWRSKVEGGHRLDQVLEQTVGRANGLEMQVARARHDYPNLAISIARRLENTSRDFDDADTFLAQASRSLVIETLVSIERAGEIETSFQSKGMTPLGPSLTALPDVAYFIAIGPGFRVHIRDLSLLTETASRVETDQIMMRQTVLLDDFSTLTPLSALAPGKHTLADLSVATAGVTMAFGGPVHVSIDNDKITVHFPAH